MTQKQSRSPQDEEIFSSEGTMESGEEKPHYIEPEFTIIDERALRRDHRHGGSFSDEEDAASFAKEEGESGEESKINLPLRFICFLGLVFCSIFGLGVLLLAILLTGLSTVLLFRNRDWNEGALRFWKLTVHTAVAGFSFLLGLLNPTLGLGLLGLYFSLNSEVVDNDLLRNIIKSSFNKL